MESLICLQYVNLLRAFHSAPNLTYSLTIEQSAQSWATYLAKTGKFEHSPGSYGENVAIVYDKRNACIKATDLWYEEVETFNFSSNMFSSGHFTQLVWKNTREIGVGISMNDKYTYVVMQFQPAGNYPGTYIDNVRPRIQITPIVASPPSPPSPPSIATSPPTQVSPSFNNIYQITIKTNTTDKCTLLYNDLLAITDIFQMFSCYMYYSGGSGSYYNISSKVKTQNIKEYIMSTLALYFFKYETITVIVNGTSTFRVKGTL